MGRRGPPRTPTPILRARGSWRARVRANEVRPPREAPRCPTWLNADGRACWKEIVPALEQLGLLARIDRQALSVYCETWSRWREATRFIQQHGSTYPIRGENGRVKCVAQFPQVSIANRLLTALLRYQQEFGLTPSGRSGLPVPMTPVSDHRAKYFRHLPLQASGA